ncbi:S24 family peptidase [Kingella sp. (in: b-proteobacteria)]|uniref:LexA family transcriptional regulator n=1 Tax=Kingella sp. (in: b-proteobacteria) TaxID=2020713 RepID=UPI0026DB316A|nr:S24 family peptidase [Kingella sp. (in: b-proteobacteria)]MDO4657069.1 S24 family peptidase [Kingella sp. (in: b-proteobacteria)]
MSAATQDDAPILERAKQALSAKSDYELSKQLGVSTSAMSGYRKRQSLPMEQCVKIAERTGVSLDWLILGKGNPQAQQQLHSAVQDYDDNDAVWVPLYDVYASAGGGADVWDEEIDQYIPFSRLWLNQQNLHSKSLSCVKVRGDSMEPTLNNGDVILVNTERQVGDGVFVVRIGNLLRVKRLQTLLNGSLKISSDNPIYEPEILHPKEVDSDFAIIGACHSKIARVA